MCTFCKEDNTSYYYKLNSGLDVPICDTCASILYDFKYANDIEDQFKQLIVLGEYIRFFNEIPYLNEIKKPRIKTLIKERKTG